MDINRRDLLKGAAVIGGTAALSGLATATQAFGADQVWDEEYDIVIAGAGGAGLVAAINAAIEDGNASIAVYEVTSELAGTTMTSGGNIGAIGTDLLLSYYENGNEFFGNDTVEMYYEDKLAAGMYYGDPAVARVFCENSQANYYWLKELGISWSVGRAYESSTFMPSDPVSGSILNASDYLQVYDENGEYKGINRKCRYNNTPAYLDYRGGSGNMQCLWDTLEGYPNAQVFFNTPLKSIVREGQISGEVQGIIVNSGGTNKAIRAKRAVVLTTGGFGANGKMMNLHDPRIDPSTRTSGGQECKGDGLVAAQFIGAQALNMHCIQIDIGLSPKILGTGNSGAAAIFGGPGDYVELDRAGKRFWNEMADVTQYMDARLTRLAECKLKTWWQLGDAQSIQARNPSEATLADFNENFGKICDTLEEVAAFMGCSAADLKETVDTYNSFVDAGKDTDFGKSVNYLTHKIEEPPFFIMESTYTCRTTPGGLRINTDAQVIDFNGDVIPRLFAAGEVTGNTHGRFRNNGGDGWTDLVCFGRIAGTNAAKTASA